MPAASGQAAPRRIAITGAPGAGKSTLLHALAAAGHATAPEVARTILTAPGGMALRAADPGGFALAMLEAQSALWRAAAHHPGVAVFDRGFADIAGFLDLAGLPIPAAIDRACRAWRYEGPVLRAPPWAAIYRQDEQRIQTWEEAVASDAAITAAWRRYGYDPIDLPLVSPAARAAFVARLLR